jgi:hypothetical protein
MLGRDGTTRCVLRVPIVATTTSNEIGGLDGGQNMRAAISSQRLSTDAIVRSGENQFAQSEIGVERRGEMTCALDIERQGGILRINERYFA